MMQTRMGSSDGIHARIYQCGRCYNVPPMLAYQFLLAGWAITMEENMGIPYLILATAPAEEPLTLTETKTYLRVDGSDDDSLITELIIAARDYAERYLQRSLITQTWNMAYDDYAPSEVRLMRGPVQSVSSVKLIARDASETTLSASTYYLGGGNERLVFDVTPVAHTVEIRYVVGYGAAADVPDAIRQGMLAHIAQMYDARGEVASIPSVTLSLYASYRMVRL